MKRSVSIFFKVLLIVGLCVSQSLAQSSDQQAYQRAVDLYNAGEWDKAKTAFQDFIGAYAGSDFVPEVYVYMAKLENDPAVSTRYFQLIVDQYPMSSVADDALMGLAQYEYARGSYQKSAELYGRLTGEYPQSELAAEASYWSANSRYLNGDIAAAEAAFNQTISTYPSAEKASWALLDLAYIYQQKKDYPTAVEKYRKLIQDYPGSDVIGAAYYRYGECLTEIGQKPEALRAYKTVLDQYPQSFEAAMVRGKNLDFSAVGGATATAAPVQKAFKAGGAQAAGTEVVESHAAAPAAESANSGVKFHIQVGAYANPDNAQLLKSSVEDANTPVTILQVDSAGKVLYRVWVGQYNSREEAEAEAVKLSQSKGIRNYMIVTD